MIDNSVKRQLRTPTIEQTISSKTLTLANKVKHIGASVAKGLILPSKSNINLHYTKDGPASDVTSSENVIFVKRSS